MSIEICAHCPICSREVIATRQPDGVYLMRLDGEPHDREVCQEAVKGRRAA